MRRVRLLALCLLAASLPGAAQQSVGKVDRMVPAGFIARGASTAEAKPADPVQWNDILRTNEQGRMRIAMEDGSQLSLGAKSELRVVKHDTQSNQTLVEMLYGKARANVVPIRKNGGSFQVRTPTAVIGVLGTTVDVETTQAVTPVTARTIEQLPLPRRNISDLLQLTPGAMPSKDASDTPSIADYTPVDGTIVRSLDHMVGVRNIDPAIVKTVFLLPGQYTFVGRGLPPTDPQFGQPPQQPRPENPQTMASPGPCPSLVDPRQFDNLFPEGKRPSYEITGRGTSTGQVFDVHIKNPTGCPLEVLIPAGAVLEPTGYTERLIKGLIIGGSMPPLKDFQMMMAEGGAGGDGQNAMFQDIGVHNFFVPPETNDIDFPLRGYCLELHKLVPHQKTKYKFADAGEQQRLSTPNLKVMEAANRLFFTGLGPPPNLAGLDAYVQWSLWASREGLTDSKHFEEQYVGLVKRNFEAQKKKFDRQTKEQVEGVAQSFWPYVQRVLEAAK